MRVYVAFESLVFHVDEHCAGLRRHGERARTQVAERLDDGSMFYVSGFHANQRLRKPRRPCAICAKAAVASTRKQERNA